MAIGQPSHVLTAVTVGAAAAYIAWRSFGARRRMRMKLQAPGIEYDTVAREWRCTVGSRDELGVAQHVWQRYAENVRAIPGVVRVQRLCCGACCEFRIVVSMRASAYDAWKATGHQPEPELLQAFRSRGFAEAHAQLLSIMDA